MLEERINLNMEFLIKREAELRDLENSQPIHTGKNEEAYSGKNRKGMAYLIGRFT